MCMNQYERILRCYREPGLGIDVQHYDESSSTRMQEHVVAMCNKQVSKVNCICSDKLFLVDSSYPFKTIPLFLSILGLCRLYAYKWNLVDSTRN